MKDNKGIEEHIPMDRTPIIVIGVIIVILTIIFSWMEMDSNKKLKELKIENTYKSNTMQMITSGEYIEYCGVQEEYYDSKSNVIWIMANGSDTEAFVLYNIDGTLRTYDGDNNFPLIQLEKLGNYMYIYYDKVTNIKYLINRKTNFGTPMLNSDGTYEVIQ